MKEQLLVEALGSAMLDRIASDRELERSLFDFLFQLSVARELVRVNSLPVEEVDEPVKTPGQYVLEALQRKPGTIETYWSLAKRLGRSDAYVRRALLDELVEGTDYRRLAKRGSHNQVRIVAITR